MKQKHLCYQQRLLSLKDSHLLLQGLLSQPRTEVPYRFDERQTKFENGIRHYASFPTLKV